MLSSSLVNFILTSLSNLLNELKSLGGDIKSVIEHIEGDKDKVGTHDIKQSIGGPKGSANERTGVKSSETQFQPKYDREKPNSKYPNATNEQILGHELKHAYNKSLGDKLSKEKRTHILRKRKLMQLNLKIKLLELKTRKMELIIQKDQNMEIKNY